MHSGGYKWGYTYGRLVQEELGRNLVRLIFHNVQCYVPAWIPGVIVSQNLRDLGEQAYLQGRCLQWVASKHLVKDKKVALRLYV